MPDPCGTKDSSDCPYEKWNYKYMGDLSATSRLSSCNLISKVSEHGPLCILGLIAIESIWRPLCYHQTQHRPIFPHAECPPKKKIKRKKEWKKWNIKLKQALKTGFMMTRGLTYKDVAHIRWSNGWMPLDGLSPMIFRTPHHIEMRGWK